MSEPSVKEFHQRVDVGGQRIAKVYARALLDAADRTGQKQDVLADCDALRQDVFLKHPHLAALFTSASVGRNARREILKQALEGRVSPLLYNFIQVLNDHERLELFRPILLAARELDDERNRRLRVIVSTAVPLETDFRERIERGVKEFFHLEPVLIERVEPALLGGLKVQIGDMVYDATIRTRIDNLRNQILARSSHEIQSGRDRFSTDAGN